MIIKKTLVKVIRAKSWTEVLYDVRQFQLDKLNVKQLKKIVALTLKK